MPLIYFLFFLPHFTLLLLFMVCLLLCAFSCVQESRAGVQAEEGESILSVHTANSLQSSARVSHTYTITWVRAVKLCATEECPCLLACLLAFFLIFLFLIALSLSFPLFLSVCLFFSD